MKPRHDKRFPRGEKSSAPYRFIIERVKTYDKDADLDLICRACEFAIAGHRGETRKSGQPYAIHPLRVAYFLTRMNMDAACVAAGALHDILENTTTTFEDLQRSFGPEVASLVDGVTTISKMENLSSEERRAEGFRHMFEAMVADRRVLFIKLCDRLHNMQTLSAMPPQSRKRIAQETMDLYVPLAARFGIYWLWRELEDLAFRHLQPSEYQSIRALRGEALKKLKHFEDEVILQITSALSHHGINVLMKTEYKTVYRIYQRMVAEGISFEEVDNLVAFRILVSGIPECYMALGIVHSLWTSISEQFKDYIHKPKANQYRSLHTTLIGPEGRQIAVQIRTRDMERVDERGATGQWSPSHKADYEASFAEVSNFVSKLADVEREEPNALEFSRTLAQALYADEVRVITPKGDLKELPKGATVIDFAYSVHSELGHRCVGALVHGKPVSIDYRIKGGDVIEILTSEDQNPQRDWLSFVRTFKAKRKIRQFLKADG